MFQHTAARRRLVRIRARGRIMRRFNTQPPEGGWRCNSHLHRFGIVSTHSRPKAAGPRHQSSRNASQVSTHSRPKAAGRNRLSGVYVENVSTHSRPKAAGHRRAAVSLLTNCFNTQPPEGGWAPAPSAIFDDPVSTHSRPKAAGLENNQTNHAELMFQHTAARRRLVSL